jgi:hypothetical protein
MYSKNAGEAREVLKFKAMALTEHFNVGKTQSIEQR